MTFLPLYKRATDKKRINQWTIEVEDNKYRTVSGFVGMKQTTSEWTVCEEKSYCTAAEQATKEAVALYRKRQEKGYFVDINKCDEEVYFQPMLAQDWDDRKDEVTFPLATQPKLDGIRCIVKHDGMWSRTGKYIVSAPHIFEALKPLFDTDSSLIFDGELYADKFNNDFNKICSLVKKTKPTYEDLKESAHNIEYHIYDLPSENKPFFQRFSKLNSLNLPSCCVKVKTEQVDNLNDVVAFYEDYMAAGYEGQILRVNSLYENKRSKNLLKHKSFFDKEFLIVDLLEGEGNKRNMVGAFLMQDTNGKQFKATPKFTWDDCINMWANKNYYIGKMGTVKYFNLTPDGVPRFPYMIGIRDYE